MSTDLTKRSRRLFGGIGAATLVALGVVSYLGVRTSHPGATYLTATFGKSAQGLDDSSDVKIRGINVGGVSKVTLDQSGRVTVQIRLNPGVKAPTTTKAEIEPLSIFGPKFIDLEPGSGEDVGPYLADGAAVAQTQDLQDLTDIAAPTYNLLNAINPQDVATLLTTFSQGTNGRGQSLGQTIDNAAKLLNLSTSDAAQLRTLIQNGAAISDVLGSRGKEIVDLAGDLNTVGATINENPAAFTALLTSTRLTAQRVTTLLDSSPGAAAAIIRSVVPAVQITYETRANTPEFITGVGSFFSNFAGFLQVKGPNNTLLGTETVHVYANDLICTFVLDACSAPPKPLPYPTGGN